MQRARVGIDDDVLENGAEAFGRAEDLWFGFRRQLDDLGVAAALEVEDTGVAPPVFIVANQAAVRVTRERRLAGTREPEKQRRVTGGADVRRR